MMAVMRQARASLGVRRILVASISAVVLMTAQGPAALAHSNEVTSEPAADSVLDSVPADVTLTFDAPLLEAGAALVVRSGDGAVVSTDPPIIDDRSITTTISDGGPGIYEVAYRIVSGDGHPVSGRYSFTVQGAASEVSTSPSPEPVPSTSAMGIDATAEQPAEPAEPQPSASPVTALDSEQGARAPNVMLIGLGLVAVALLLGLVAFLGLRRRSTRPEPGHGSDGDR